MTFPEINRHASSIRKHDLSYFSMPGYRKRVVSLWFWKKNSLIKKIHWRDIKRQISSFFFFFFVKSIDVHMFHFKCQVKWSRYKYWIFFNFTTNTMNVTNTMNLSQSFYFIKELLFVVASNTENKYPYYRERNVKQLQTIIYIYIFIVVVFVVFVLLFCFIIIVWMNLFFP